MSTIRYLDPAEQAMMAWQLERSPLLVRALDRALQHWAPATTPARQQERRDLSYVLAFYRFKCE